VTHQSHNVLNLHYSCIPPCKQDQKYKTKSRLRPRQKLQAQEQDRGLSETDLV